MSTPRQIVAFILNLPWTIIGIVAALISVPRRVHWSKNPVAALVYVQSFWWYHWMPSKRGVRAMAIGHIGLAGRRSLQNDLEHELIHISQAIREPFIHPFLNAYQNFRYGYRQNKYEVEAYKESDSVYVER